jgi:hypothetical protein
MDVHCCNCGEPWGQYHLRHELVALSAEELAADGWKHGSRRLVVLRCPCCPANGSPLPDPEERGQIAQHLADLMCDDEDGLASMPEDFGV